jgi:immunoglobulin-like protein involved in spore germination
VRTSKVAMIWVAFLLAAVLATGCGQGSREEQGTGTTEHSAQRGAPFTATPKMKGGLGGAADSIRGVRFGKHEGYERALIDFGSGGAPASRVPAWSLNSPAGEGYARITLPDIDATSETDGVFGGAILDNFYVVRAPGGGMFVDVFATGAFRYRVMELSDPGRLVLDYRPTKNVDLSFPIPARAEKTVLFEPRRGEAITSPLRVSGYSRNFEASNTIALRASSGDVLSQRTVLSNDWSETWGYFEASLGFPAFEGPAALRVGGVSPRDGSFEGVEVPLTYGGGSLPASDGGQRPVRGE